MQLSTATADYFAAYDYNRLKNLVVVPPYERKDGTSSSMISYVRGSLKVYSPNDGPPMGVPKSFVFTGPRMRVSYGGCRWNRMVFSMNNGPECSDFEQWIENVNKLVKNAIFANPDKYKTGNSKTSLPFTFEDDIIKESSDPTLYPPELRTRLSVQSGTETSDAYLFRIEDGDHILVDPSEITAGSYVVPVIRLSYYRNSSSRFGLTLTVVKARVWLNDLAANKINNEDWVMDTTPMNMDLEN